jgi:hypothetical protein
MVSSGIVKNQNIKEPLKDWTSYNIFCAKHYDVAVIQSKILQSANFEAHHLFSTPKK